MKPNEKPQACCVQTMFCSSKKTKIRQVELVDRLNVSDEHFTCYLSHDRLKSLILFGRSCVVINPGFFFLNRSKKKIHCTNKYFSPLMD